MEFVVFHIAVSSIQEDQELELLSYKLLLPEDRQSTVYMYNDYSVVIETGMYSCCTFVLTILVSHVRFVSKMLIQII